jgi:hypothetical protein
MRINCYTGRGKYQEDDLVGMWRYVIWQFGINLHDTTFHFEETEESHENLRQRYQSPVWLAKQAGLK